MLVEPTELFKREVGEVLLADVTGRGPVSSRRNPVRRPNITPGTGGGKGGMFDSEAELAPGGLSEGRGLMSLAIKGVDGRLAP